MIITTSRCSSSQPLNGSNRSEIIIGSSASQTINGNGGSDLIFGGGGNDIINGGSGRDLLFGGRGSDTINGGSGADYVNAGSGADTLIFDASDRVSRGFDYYNGGSGSDTLVLRFTANQWNTPGFQDEVAAFNEMLANGTGNSFYFDSLKLFVRSVESIVVEVGGEVIDPDGTVAPIAVSDVYTTSEDDILSGSVVVNDTTGTGFAVTLVNGPENGIVVLNEDGSFSFEPGDAFQELAAGEQATETFSYIITNSEGVSETATATVTITGQNDIANIAGNNEASVAEDAQLTASGSITVIDADAGQSLVIPQSDVEGTFGNFSIDADGNWTFDLSNDLAATQALAGGVTATETFAVSSADGTASIDVTVTVTGQNDVANLSGDVDGSATEDGGAQSTATGQIIVSDIDADENLLIAQTDIETSYGTFSISDDGNWTYVLNNDLAEVQGLGINESLLDVIQVTSVDGTTTDVTITIQGSNDAAIVSGSTAGEVTEDANTTATGTLLINDADDGQSQFIPRTDIEGDFGVFNITADGEWTYVLDNSAPAIQELNAGETITEQFTNFSIDGSYAGLITITINGSDDDVIEPPAIGAEIGVVVRSSEDAVSFTVPDDALTGVDSFSATLDDGASLPSWLTFDEATLTFSGSPTSDENGVLRIVLTGENGDGETVSQLFFLALGDNILSDVEGANTTINGTTGSDVIASLDGSDVMNGGGDDDIYVYRAGDGADTIDDFAFTDEVEYDAIIFADYNYADATIVFDDPTYISPSILLDFGNGDIVNLPSALLSDDRSRIEEFHFADGIYTTEQILVDVYANAANDLDQTIYGSSANDTIAGGRGDDELRGGSGGDTYVYNAGDGLDKILDRPDDVDGPDDTLVVNGYDFEEVTIRVESETLDEGTPDELFFFLDSLILEFADGGGIKIETGAVNFGSEIEEYVFNGVSYTYAEIAEYVIATATTNGDDFISGLASDDVLEGGKGDDFIRGCDGNDTFIFNVGDGADTIYDESYVPDSSNADVLEFTGYELGDAVIDRDDLTYFLSGGGVETIENQSSNVMLDFGGGDSVNLNFDFLSTGSDNIEFYQFTDRRITIDEIAQLFIDSVSTAGADSISGWTGRADILEGGTGNDSLYGLQGSDTYIFNVGDGNDIIDDRGFDDGDIAVFVDRNFADAQFVQDGDDLLISFTDGSGDTIRVIDGDVEEFQFADMTVSYDTILLGV